MAGSGDFCARLGSSAVLPEPDVLRMLDQVAEFVMLARPVRDGSGRLIGFRVVHLSPALAAAEAGRGAAEGLPAAEGLFAAEGLPAAGGLADVAASVLASG